MQPINFSTQFGSGQVQRSLSLGLGSQQNFASQNGATANNPLLQGFNSATSLNETLSSVSAITSGVGIPTNTSFGQSSGQSTLGQSTTGVGNTFGQGLLGSSSFSQTLPGTGNTGSLPGTIQAFQPAAATPGTFPSVSSTPQSLLNAASKIGDSSVFNRMPFNNNELLSGINLVNPPGSANAGPVNGSSNFGAASSAFGLNPLANGSSSPLSGFNGLGTNVSGNLANSLGLPIPGLSGAGGGLDNFSASSVFGFGPNSFAGGSNDSFALLSTILSSLLSGGGQAQTGTGANQPEFIAVPIANTPAAADDPVTPAPATPAPAPATAPANPPAPAPADPPAPAPTPPPADPPAPAPAPVPPPADPPADPPPADPPPPPPGNPFDDSVLDGAAKGAEIGSVAGPAGEVIGAGIGAAVDFLGG